METFNYIIITSTLKTFQINSDIKQSLSGGRQTQDKKMMRTSDRCRLENHLEMVGV